MTSLLTLCLAAALQAAAEKAPPIVQDIEVRGNTVFDREALVGLARLRSGEPLRRSPDLVGQGLTKRYRLAGYPAARVSATFDEATGRLLIEVEEGRLTEVTVDGLSGAASRRAIQALGLRTGEVLREGDIWSAIARLERDSEGSVQATGEPSYSIEPTAQGARLVLHVRHDPALVAVRPWGPRAAGRNNRADGLSLGLATEVALTDGSSYNHLRLLARAAYGFSSEKVRYTLGVERTFLAAHGLSAGYEYHDLTDSEDAFRRYGLEELPGGTINTQNATDLFRRLGHEAHVFAHLGERADVGVAFRSDGYTSLPVTTNDDEPNPRVEEGRMRSIVGTVRFASRGDLFRNRRLERESFVFPSLYLSPALKPQRWRAEATYEVSRPGLGSDFDFSRFIGRVRLHRPVSPRHAFDAVGYGGFSTGRPPLPKRFFLGGLGTLRGFEKKQFTGENMALAIAEWSWFPPSRWAPAVIPFYDGAALWGGDFASTGWKHDGGLGLRWPQTSRVFARVDAAAPFNPAPGQKRKVQWNLRVQIPF